MSVDINATLVKELREKTGVGMMECKKALQESGGDKEKAIKILRERGVAKAEKRSGRAAAQGTIGFRISANDRKGVMVDFNCETDFVSRNDNYKSFLAKLVDFVDAIPAGKLPAAKPNGEIPGESVLDTQFSGAPKQTLREAIVDQIATTGENLVFRRFASFETAKGFITGYIHPPGIIGVLVELDADGGTDGLDKDALQVLGKDVAMHIAASAPRYLDRSVVDTKHLESEKDIFANKARNEGKPDAIIPKIVEGMVQKFYKDVCLVDQPFVKDPNTSVGKLVEDTGKKLGKKLSVKRFVRLQVGEEAEG